MQLTQENIPKIYRYLFGGVLASVTASICCIGPFALLATGISGAWMSRVMVVEPFQPLLAGTTIILFALASRKIFFSKVADETGGNCLTVAVQRKQKIVYCVSGVLALVLLTSEYWIVVFA